METENAKWICVHCERTYQNKPAICAEGCDRKDFQLLWIWNRNRNPELPQISPDTNYEELAKNVLDKQPIHYDTAKNWWIWNTKETRWRTGDEIDIFNAIKNHVKNSEELVKPKVRLQIIAAIKQEGRNRQPKELDENQVQFLNEIWNVETGEHAPATPEYFTTNPLPWRVDAEEEATPGIDALFEAWIIKEGHQDHTWTRTLYEVMAYAMLTKQPLQTLIALTGAGANGKGTFIRLLKKFLGTENCATTELHALQSRSFETSFLYRKLAVFMSEISQNDIKNTNLLKSLSGEDDIRYEFKGKGVFSAKSYATIIMATNALPLTPDKSAGYYRRWLSIDFPNTFQNNGVDLLEKIPDYEFERLARKLIRIAGELLRQGCFTNAGTTDEKMKRYEERSNPVGYYISLFFEDDVEAYIRQKDFCEELNNWLPQHNNRRLSNRTIGILLRELGYEVKPRRVALNVGQDAQYNVIYGIRRRTVAEWEQNR